MILPASTILLDTGGDLRYFFEIFQLLKYDDPCLSLNIIMNHQQSQSAKRKRQQGLLRDNNIPVIVPPPHPRFGGDGYPVWLRKEDINNHVAGNRISASLRSVQRWQNCLNPFEHSGNQRQPNFSGLDLFHLVLYRQVFPKASLDEIASFLFASNALNPLLYSRNEVSKCELYLDLTRKAANTTAQQALLPINLFKRYMFWNTPMPIGVLNQKIYTLLDTDECGLFIETANRGFGNAYKRAKIRILYTRRLNNFLVLLHLFTSYIIIVSQLIASEMCGFRQTIHWAYLKLSRFLTKSF